MEAQFIEKDSKRLYSVYHPPASLNNNNDWGMVLCNPLAHEYIHCHKFYVNLANRVATKGFHALRFDYHGTGDSSGDFSSVSLHACMQDIALAIGTLKESCGISKVMLFGVRMGATLALLYSQIFKVDTLILWSPVYSGKYYLDEIVDEYKSWLAGTFTKDHLSRSEVVSFGYSFSSLLANEIRSIVLSKTQFEDCARTLLIDHANVSGTEQFTHITFEKSVNGKVWLKKDDQREKAIVPVYELNKIENWLNVQNEY